MTQSQIRNSNRDCAIVWFRRDLRLADNPALSAAIGRGFTYILPVFIHTPEELAPWAPGGAQRVWLHFSLTSLDADLRATGSRLIVRRGTTQTILDRLIAENGATAVFWNRLYDPQTIEHDARIKRQLKRDGIEASSFNSALLHEPWQIETNQGRPYKVFTPFWKNAGDRPVMAPLAEPAALPTVPLHIDSLDVADLALLPDIPWDRGIRAAWQPGEQNAHDRLDAFVEKTLHDYSNARNRPDCDGTSRLSPHLHFGEIGPRQIMHRVDEWRYTNNHAAHDQQASAFINEIGWREFAHHVLYHFPETPFESMDKRFQRFSWVDPDNAGRTALQRWQHGRTGIPMIDAGMRELWATGYMHNRLRMTVASFLTKNLRLPWQIGARWFWDTLVDADLANNTLGWQWAAGCGADAAPFFRIFNPVRQGERFDPEGTYVRHWVPELAALPNKHLNRPWLAPANVLEAAGIQLGYTYPEPLVDLKASRKNALAAFDRIRKHASSSI